MLCLEGTCHVYYYVSNGLICHPPSSLVIPPTDRDPASDEGTISADNDLRLSRIFKDNMASIAVIDKQSGVKPLFVPQILNYAPAHLKNKYGWIPFIRGRDMRFLMQEMNKDLERVARKSGVVFIGAPLAANWTEADFSTKAISAPPAPRNSPAIASDVTANCQ